MKAREILDRIKAVFTDATQGAPADTTPPADTSANAVVYTLQDGTQISINQAGDLPANGDIVNVAGVPAPAGTLTLNDGSLITCDATGAITDYTPGSAGPVTTDLGADGKPKPTPAVPAAAAPAKAAPAAQVTPAMMADMMTKFAVGTPEDRVANLEIICKALMQSEFGWQILEQQRLADANAAINIYNTTLKVQAQKFEAQETLVAGLVAANKKQEEVIKGMFELVEKLVELPTAAPVTLTGVKKEQFERAKKKEIAIENIAAALKEIKENKKKS